MRMRAVRSLLLAVVLFAAPLYLLARAPLAQKLDFYGEALCPDCAQFTSKILAPLFVTGVSSAFSLRYVGWGNAHRKKKGAVVCQHGPRECELNRVLNCAQELSSNQDAFFRFLVCVEDGLFGWLDGDKLLAACADTASLNATAVGACADGELGDALEKQAEADTPQEHTFVPWMTIDGRSVGAECGDVGSLVCAAYTGQAPDACADQPVKQPCPGAPKRLVLPGAGGKA
ncbi:hypothetical protein WJX81_001626 [Elliptochloris bilobata]|uniref:Gamma-interferon-inducible lysosomal thiol reductase n=1 Tax=Elliptochloris bilobata TaxID=381761 RepID=A0AAW1RHY1_9CHLO